MPGSGAGLVPGLHIEHLGPDDEERVRALEHLLDGPALPDATRRFLSEPGHHLLAAFVGRGSRALGFLTAVETVHPDKGTEMFIYELAVDPTARRQGIGRSLVTEVTDLARRRNCYSVWVLADADNRAALATYRSAGLEVQSSPAMLGRVLHVPG